LYHHSSPVRPFCHAVSAFAQTKPKPSEIFESEGRIYVKRGNTTYFGRGWWRNDSPGNKGRQFFEFEGASHIDFDFIERYDLGKVYEVTGHPPKCNSSSVTGQMQATWGWLTQATYKGRKVVDHVPVDIWSYAVGGVTLNLYVRPQDVNVPVGFERVSSTETVMVHFDFYHTQPPQPVWFTVPRIALVIKNHE